MGWHYTCNGKKFIGKIQAVKESHQSGQMINFVGPDSFSTHDWSIDSAESLDTLLKLYATKIRDENKKIRVWYSGGCDSHVMLDSFLRNKIHIDEIVCVKSGVKPADFEIDNYALPYLDKIRHTIPNTDINVVSHSYDFYKQFYSDDSWPDKFLSLRPTVQHFHFRFSNTNFVKFDTLNNEYVNVWGKDKPRLKYVDGKWYTYFFDVDIEPCPNQINFFSDDPVIHAKQCHMVIKQIENNYETKDYNQITDYSTYQDQWNKMLGRYEQTVFPLKDLEQDTISEYTVYTGKEKKALEYMNAHYPETVHGWAKGLKKLSTIADGKWWNNGKPEMGTIGIFEKFYCLTEKSTKTVDELYPDGFFM